MSSADNKADELIAFLDANIVLEGRPLTDLPWDEVEADGLIRVLIVPKAMEEIDAKKRDGRLGPHARAFNRLIGPSVISGQPIILRESGPRVELEMATCSRIPWGDYDELDPDDGDSRIVAEALNIRNAAAEKRILISHDIKPLVYARGRGLPVYQASDDWLRASEPGPKDKEIQRLKQQLAEFRKDEPTFNISIEISDCSPAEIYRVAPLNAAQSEDLIHAIRRRNPKQPNGRDDFGAFGVRFGSSIGIGQDRDSSYDAEYRKYYEQKIPEFVSDFNEKIERLFNQRKIKIVVSNSGNIRADNFVLSIRSNQGWINRNIVALRLSGPIAPVPRPDYLRHYDASPHFMRQQIPNRVGRHEFETNIEARRSQKMEVACEDFRSRQHYQFEGVVVPAAAAEPLEITVSITAKNLRGEFSRAFCMEKKIVETRPDELVDLETLELLKNYPVQCELARLVETEMYAEIEWDDV